MARDCQEAASSFKVCYRCNEKGHLARDCTQEGKPRNEQSEQDLGKSCYRCNEKGHLAKDCNNNFTQNRQSESGTGGEGGDRTCYNCGKQGHISRECPESGLNRERDSSRRLNQTKCYNCGDFGHIAAKCQSAMA